MTVKGEEEEDDACPRNRDRGNEMEMEDEKEKRLDVHKDGEVKGTLMNKFHKAYRLVGNTFENKSRFVERVVSLCFITVSLLLRGNQKSLFLSFVLIVSFIVCAKKEKRRKRKRKTCNGESPPAAVSQIHRHAIVASYWCLCSPRKIKQMQLPC